ncbi:MAG TPA: ribonuclease J, partial [Magnetospirillaceae bacterium]
MIGTPSGLVFLPLGGSGEIGMNLNLYGYDGQWILVDVGVSFGDETMPGIDVFMADPAFIAERRKDLLGIVLTHAHEDHLGAIPYLWPLLGGPVYATPFAAAMLRTKLDEAKLLDRIVVHEVPQGGRIKLGPFTIDLVTVTHS